MNLVFTKGEINQPFNLLETTGLYKFYENFLAVVGKRKSRENGHNYDSWDERAKTFFCDGEHIESCNGDIDC